VHSEDGVTEGTGGSEVTLGTVGMGGLSMVGSVLVGLS